MRSLVVRGIGRVSVVPDLIELNLKLIVLDLDYSLVVSEIDKKVIRLTNNLESVGIKQEDIKTSYFTIDSKYENIPNNKGIYESHFIGYQATMNMKVFIALDFRLLGEVLNVIKLSEVNPELSMQFTIRDNTKSNEQLLHLATQDAINKANVLAKTSGVKLIQINSIHTINKDTPIYSNARVMATSMEINPENIELEEIVEITYLIE